jgi:acyl carrier protein
MDKKRFKQMWENARELCGINKEVKQLQDRIFQLRAKYEGMVYNSIIEYAERTIRDRLNDDTVSITCSDRLREDLGMDTVDVYRLKDDLEEGFQCSLPKDTKFETFEDVINLAEILTKATTSWEDL